MGKSKTTQRIKIFVSLLLALVVVAYGAPQVFVAGTPQIKSNFVAQLESVPLRFLGFIQHPVDSGTRTDTVETALMDTHGDKKNLEYRPIGKGVYAAEDPFTKERFIKIEKGTKVEKRFVTINGQEVGVYVPAE